LGRLVGLGPVAIWLQAKSEAQWNNDISLFPLDFAMEFQIISEFDSNSIETWLNLGIYQTTSNV
jgi:hypothetical protein